MPRWVDVSRYQIERAKPLTPALVKSAGYDIINLAMTGGRGYVAGPWFEAFARDAVSLGLGRSTYHWLDGRTSGAAQAAVNLTRLRNVFGASLEGFAYCVDVEETGGHGITPPRWQHVYDHVNAMQDALSRPVAIYSADYYWKPKGWPGSTLTPYVMGPPNGPANKAPRRAVMLQEYPGDASPHWRAGWGGWADFAILQWGVRPLPGTGDCSLSVIRDPAVWADLIGDDIVKQADKDDIVRAVLAGMPKPPTAADVIKALMEHKVFVPYADPKDPTRTVEIILGYGSPSASWHDKTHRIAGEIATVLRALVESEGLDDARTADALARIEGHLAAAPEAPASSPAGK